MTKNIGLVLKDVLEKVKPSKEELKEIEKNLAGFLSKIKKNIKKLKISAEVFLGGSFAKNTVVKKDFYDLDIFIRFDKKHKDKDLSQLTAKILSGIKAERVHGSRDYFRIAIRPGVFFEVVPVRKVNSPKESENVTDLSYSHVAYIKKKVKNEKLLDEIRIAKAFGHGTRSYGAESYIRGFSGYALELLIYHYGSFIKFLKAMVKIKSGQKEVIDIEKRYKSKNQILMDVNGAKLQSPVVLIDPTYKQRNVLAALSDETFKKFQEEAKKFLKNPSESFFEAKHFNAKGIADWAKKANYQMVVLEAETGKQEGDVAGTKLLKFSKHLESEISKIFEVKKTEFEYHGENGASYVFVVKPKKEILITGPETKDKKNVDRFKKSHKKFLIKNGRLYSNYRPDFTIKQFLQNWKTKNKMRMKEMQISGLEVLG